MGKQDEDLTFQQIIDKSAKSAMRGGTAGGTKIQETPSFFNERWPNESWHLSLCGVGRFRSFGNFLSDDRLSMTY